MQNRDLLKLGAEELASVGVQSPSLEARILLAQSCQESQEYLLLNFDQEVSDTISKRYLSYIERRKQHEPIAYITGLKEFYGRDFIVNHDVLIPRAETELLIEVITKNIQGDENISVLDLGSGSGIIAITLALELPYADIVAVDVSEKALACLRQNIKKYNVTERVIPLLSNWYELVEEKRFDIIVSNPPYISKLELDYMAEETKRYEPDGALFAKDDGLACYRQILQNAANYLSEKGRIYLEMGFNQCDKIAALAKKYKFNVEEVYWDLQGHKRAVCLRLDK